MTPKPASNFLSSQCSDCKEERIIYSHSSSTIYCRSCNKLLVQPTGARAIMLGKVLKTLD
ncbi:MAG TPA: 30S ribosomal protein S27e [Candidatus Nitrosopolaris sp.]